MSYTTVVIGSAAELSPGLRQALSGMRDARLLGTVNEWSLLLAVIERERPSLVLLDRALWRAASPRRLLRLSTSNPTTRFLMFCDAMDVSVVSEAIAYGVHGCMANGSTALQWINAIDVVLREDIAMPRKLLAQALQKALHWRADDLETPLAEGVDTEALTERERDVIRCVTSGMTNKEVALRLGISGATVKTHLHHVFGKLHVSRRMLLLPGSQFSH